MYKREMSIKQKDFVFEDKNQRRKFKAATYQGPKKIYNFKKPNSKLMNVANAGGNYVDYQREEMSRRNGKPVVVKYRDIMRVIVTLQRKFREKRMNRALHQD